MSQCKGERVNVDKHVMFCIRDADHIGLHADATGHAWGPELSEHETVTAIVAWLRRPVPGTMCDDQHRDNAIADAIERGEWK